MFKFKKKESLIFDIILYSIMCLIIQGCGSNSKEIKKQKLQDSIQKVDSISKIKDQIRHDSIAAIREQGKDGEIVWQNAKNGYFIDLRDKHIYKVIKIGNQIWMAQNLAYKPNTGRYWAANNDERIVGKYGYLYDFETAKKVAPIGWHLPRKIEWETFCRFLSADEKKIYHRVIEGGTSGFNALLAGCRKTSGEFGGLWKSAFFWGNNNIGESQQSTFYVYKLYSRSGMEYPCLGCGFSIRLIKD